MQYCLCKLLYLFNKLKLNYILLFICYQSVLVAQQIQWHQLYVRLWLRRSLMLSIELFIQITVFKDCLSNLDCFNGGYCLRLSSSVSVCSCQPGYTGNRMFFFCCKYKSLKFGTNSFFMKICLRLWNALVFVKYSEYPGENMNQSNLTK